jgi:integrase
MDLALLTGQRQGTLLKLKWSQVTPEGVLIQQANKGGKKGKRLLIEMSPTLEAVLVRAKAFLPHLPREYVIRNRKGRAYSQNGFRKNWQTAMAKFVKAGGLRFTFHDLRAKSASDAVTIQDAFERLGHTSMAMTRGVYDRGVRKVKPLK